MKRIFLVPLLLCPTLVMANNAVLDVEGVIKINGNTAIDAEGQFVVGDNVIINKDGVVAIDIPTAATYNMDDFPDSPAAGKSVTLTGTSYEDNLSTWITNLVVSGQTDGWTRVDTPTSDASLQTTVTHTFNNDGSETISKTYANGDAEEVTTRTFDVLSANPDLFSVGQSWAYVSIDQVSDGSTFNSATSYPQSKNLLFVFSGLTDITINGTTLTDCGRFTIINENDEKGFQIRCAEYGIVENLWPTNKDDFWREVATALDAD